MPAPAASGPGGGDPSWGEGARFAAGDYSGALFHHDVSESAIELCRDPDLAEACFGSLLCFLDTAHPNGRIHRIEMPLRARDPEPAKPVMAQLARRAIAGIERGLERADQHRVLPRLLAFLSHLERETTGRHGLLLTPSCRASGFDSDALTAGFPDYSVEGPDTSTFLVLEYEAAAALARDLGQDAVADELTTKAERVRELMNLLLWSASHGTYVALHHQHGARRHVDEIVGEPDADGVLHPIRSWIEWLPLYAGVPSADQAARLFSKLLDPAEFWGPAGVRTTPASDPTFQQAPRIRIYDPRRHKQTPVSNWSGPVWVLSNYYAFRALERYGRLAEARALALTTARTLAEDLRATGSLHECYADDGRGLWPRHGDFVSWNVLARTMLRDAAAFPVKETPA